MTENIHQSLENEPVTLENAAGKQIETHKTLELRGLRTVAAGLLGLMTLSAMEGCAQMGALGDAIGQEVHSMNEQARANYNSQFIRDESGRVVSAGNGQTKEYGYFYGQVSAGAGASYPGGAGYGVSNSVSSGSYKEQGIFDKDKRN